MKAVSRTGSGSPRPNRPQPDRPQPNGQRARRRGDLAEFLCRVHLRLRGWRIVARDWRCPAGEIDIVARRGNVLAIVEAKARPPPADAASAITPRQRRRIARAASAFLLT